MFLAKAVWEDLTYFQEFSRSACQPRWQDWPEMEADVRKRTALPLTC
jgi:hypothetical protein